MSTITKTTLVCTDEKSMVVLKRCGAIADNTIAGSASYEAFPANDGMLITVSYGDDIGWLTQPRSSTYEQEVNYVIIPYGQRERLEEIHRLTTGRNVIFIPQIPIKAANESDYYLQCALDAAGSIKALIKLVKSYYSGIMAVNGEDLAKIPSYGENTYKAIFSVSEKLGKQSIDDCIDKVMSHRLVRAKPVMTLYEAFFPLQCEMQHLEKLKSAFDKSMIGLTFDECGPEVVIVAVYDKVPE